jgi:hypothetical protein
MWYSLDLIWGFKNNIYSMSSGHMGYIKDFEKT